MSRIDVVGQNGNDGLHYEEKDIDKKWDQMKPVGKEYEYELDKSTGEVVKKYTAPINELEKQLYDNHMLASKPDGFTVSDYVKRIKNDGFKKVKK